MYKQPEINNISQAEQHIRELFQIRGKNDPNSTTLANTLDKDIQTVFNSIGKFIFELIQNADDAGFQNNLIEMSFAVRGRLLIFSHNGKHFDQEDVETICDNAQRKNIGKSLDVEKTGYKGIGFKSVFVITDRIYIISKEYTFRFDRHFPKWQISDSNNVNAKYPWQIIPIWTPLNELFDNSIIENKIDLTKVNFVLEIRQGIEIENVLSTLLSSPKVILFLRKTKSIAIDTNNHVTIISLEKNGNIQSLYVNTNLVNQFLGLEEIIFIPDDLKAQIQQMGEHECPKKFKEVQHINITLMAELLAANKLAQLKNVPLYSYLPTLVQCGFPFLVNTNFLLNADRTQLLENAWNSYIFDVIAKVHLFWLRKLAQQDEMRKQTLILFTPKLANHIPPIFKTAYDQSVQDSLKEINFIPSYKDPMTLLKVGEAIIDHTEFYKAFPGLDMTIEEKIIQYELEEKSKLEGYSKKFNYCNLIEHVEVYAESNKTISFQIKLLAFLKNKCQGYHVINHLKQKKFVLTQKNELFAPEKVYFSTKDITSFPSFLALNFVHSELVSVSTRRDWLSKMMGIKEPEPENLLKEIVRQDRKILEQHTIEIISFVYNLYCAGEIKPRYWTDLKKLPLLTQANTFRPAETCYLSSALYPEMDLQRMGGNNELFISDRYVQNIFQKCVEYEIKKDDIPNISEVKKLGKLFKEMNVMSCIKCHFELQWNIAQHSPTIDCYTEYIEYVKKTHCVSFYNERVRQIENFVFFDFLRFLQDTKYACFFWESVAGKWNKILDYFSDTKIIVRSKRGETQKKITPYLVYFLSEIPCIKAVDGQLYKTRDLYAPTIIEKLGKRLSSLFLQMNIDLTTIIKEKQILEEILQHFRFKNKISVEDCMRLIKFIEDHDDEYRQEDYEKVLDVMLSQECNDFEKNRLRALNVNLLARDNTLQPVSSLYFFQGVISPNRISQKNLIKTLPGFTLEQMLNLCGLFNVQLLDSCNLLVEYSQIQQDHHVKNNLLEQLIPFWATIEEKHMKTLRKECTKEELYSEWYNKVSKLNFYAVEDLIVKSELIEPFSPEIIIHNDNFFYPRDFLLESDNISRNRIFKNIVDFLKLSDGTKLDVMETIEYDNEKRLKWLEEEGYDIKGFNRFLTKVSEDNKENQEKCDDIKAIQTPFDIELQNNISVIEVEPGNVDCDKIEFEKEQKVQFSTRFFKNNSSIEMDESRSDDDEVFNEVKTDMPFQYVNKEMNQLNTICPSVQSEVDTEAIGRWGEEVVFHQLKTIYKAKYPGCFFKETAAGFIIEGKNNFDFQLLLEVIWHNKNGESGKSIDLEIIKNGKKRYVEVKSTLHACKSIARFSKREWQFMREYGEQYSIFCVHNAGKKEGVKIKKIKDPVKRMLIGELEPHEIQFKI